MNTNKSDSLKAQARAWWIRLDSGSLNAKEQADFEAWLAINPLHQQAMNDLNNLWLELDATKARLSALVPAQEPKRRSLFNRWQYSAVGLAMCCLVLLLINPLSLLLQADFYTGIGEIQTIQLADGSTVILNSDSALSVNFNTSSRQLTLLKGEAAFQVNKDPKRPFQVHAGQGTVTALGTAFTIDMHDESTEVIVTEHSVAVSIDTDNPSANVVVASGQHTSYSVETNINTPTAIDTHTATAWQRGKLVFQDKLLSEVITELNRYHRGYFLISDNSIAQRRVNGVFHTDKPLVALAAIEQSLQLHATHLSEYLILLHQ